MWNYHADLLAGPMPRYTSYPTAAEFCAAVGAAEMEAALGAVAPDAAVSLYVHIPYCREICWYCGCNTGAANRQQRLAAYLQALDEEIGLVAARLGGRGRVARIAFGGGSPNAIAALEFVRLVDRLVTAFGAENAILSVELDPRGLTPDWVAAMGAAGVARASLGVQTFAPHVQRAIGRVQPLETVRAVTEQLRRHGVRSLNFDLMYGLPHQGVEDLLETLDAACAIGPNRIALFGYAHVPQMIPRQRRIDASALPGAEARFAQAAEGHARLVASGYSAIGFDHFALPGDPLEAAARGGGVRRNFQGFTEDDSEVLIGLGASAVSSFPDLIVQNEKNAGRYRMLVSAERLPAARGLIRSREDQLRGRIIERLLCDGEADVAGLCLGRVLERLEPFRAAGLASVRGTTVRLAAEALPYARAVAATFDSYLHPAEKRFSRAV